MVKTTPDPYNGDTPPGGGGASSDLITDSQAKGGLAGAGIWNCVLIASDDFQRGCFSVMLDTLTFRALT